jgi:hypothetical protein
MKREIIEGFAGDSFRRVWNSLSESTKNRIRAKAEWEHMSLSAVMRDWWPRLWKRVRQV